MQINKKQKKEIIGGSVFGRYVEIQWAYSGIEKVFSNFICVLYTPLQAFYGIFKIGEL